MIKFTIRKKKKQPVPLAVKLARKKYYRKNKRDILKRAKLYYRKNKKTIKLFRKKHEMLGK